MADYCGAAHPEDQARTCRQSLSDHRNHADGAGLWPNSAYEGPTLETLRSSKKHRAKGGANRQLGSFLGSTPIEQGTEEGRVSLRGILADPERGPIMQAAIRRACEQHEVVTTNDVRVALDDAGFVWPDNHGFMGAALSQYARQRHWVGPPIGKGDNENDGAHSGLPVNRYPSLLHKSTPG